MRQSFLLPLHTECTTNKPGHCPLRKDSLLTTRTLSKELRAESEVHSGRILGLYPGDAEIGLVLCRAHFILTLDNRVIKGGE